jgi:hypothetical protein
VLAVPLALVVSSPELEVAEVTAERASLEAMAAPVVREVFCSGTAVPVGLVVTEAAGLVGPEAPGV